MPEAEEREHSLLISAPSEASYLLQGCALSLFFVPTWGSGNAKGIA
jgi:hypothetical protein